MNILKINNWKDIPKNYTGITEYLNGDKVWYLKGLRHRVDGPAIEYENGDKHWYFNGLYHRDDGPAIECKNGFKAWYINGLKHRINGPAIESSDEYKAWCLNGVHYSQEEWFDRLNDEDKLEAIWNLR
jgi:hypothetical protein